MRFEPWSDQSKDYKLVFSDSLVLVYHQGRRNRKGGVMVSMIGQSVVECGFESRSDQTKNYKIGICSFSAKHASLKSYLSKIWLTGNRNNVSKWSDMFTL